MNNYEEPPPLDDDFIEESPAIEPNEHIKEELPNRNSIKYEDTDTTILEKMMSEAQIAKQKKDKVKTAQRKKASKSFGQGLKKGFFQQKTTNNPKKTKKETKDPIPTIKPKTTTNENLRIPEVQEALKQFNGLDKSDWMTPDFMKKIAADPKLCLALQNPRFTQAMEELKANPQEAMKKYGKDPDLYEMFTHFMKFLGNHFEDLGKKKEEEENEKFKENLQKQALENMPCTKEEEAQVQKILQDNELRDILSDSNMRAILQECQMPGRMQKYMQDPVTGPKLRKLLDAGLIQVQS